MLMNAALELDEIEQRETRSPEKNLLIAALNRAVLDYLGNQKDVRDDAAAWLFSPAGIEEEFSFKWVCQHLEIDADTFKKGLWSLRSENRKNNTKQKRWYISRGPK